MYLALVRIWTRSTLVSGTLDRDWWAWWVVFHLLMGVQFVRAELVSATREAIGHHRS